MGYTDYTDLEQKQNTEDHRQTERKQNVRSWWYEKLLKPGATEADRNEFWPY